VEDLQLLLWSLTADGLEHQKISEPVSREEKQIQDYGL